MANRASIGAAVIGTGFIGTVHIEALRRIGVNVLGVLGSTPERGAARADALGVPKGYGSLDDLLSDDRVRVVHVTSPNDLHLSQAEAALRAGKHVVCEKPLAMTADESARLVALAAETGLINATNFNIRYYPLNQHVRSLIADGGLGEVRLVTGRYFQDWLLLESDWNWRLQPDRGGALRAVGDIGSHWLDLMTFVIGQHVASVMADLTTFIGTRREPTGPVETFSTDRSVEAVDRAISTEDTATILLRFDGGARGAVSISQISPGRKNSLVYEIDGSDGAWAWDSEQPDQAWIGHRERPNERLLREAGDYPPGHAEGFPDTFKHLYRAVYRAVAAGGPPADPDYPTFADGHDEALIADAIERSHAEQRWVAVAPVPQEV